MLALALALLVADPSPAERLTRAHASLDALEYEAAALELALAAADPTATEAQKIEANLYAGIAHRILGQDTEARLNFVYVLKRAPETELPPGLSPKIQSFYDLVREELAVPPAVATPAPHAAPSLQLPLVVAGGAALVAGAAVLAVGSQPWFQHESAVDALRRAAAEGADGTDLQREQTDTRASWESWGMPTAVSGAVLAGVGVVVAGVALVALGDGA